MKRPQKTSILLVEDDSLDAEIFTRGLGKHNIEVELEIATNGQDALQFIRYHEANNDSKKLIVLVDLNMPGMNGHEFIGELRDDEKIRKTTVFVLTSSDHRRDIEQAYERNVAGYFLKSEMALVFEALKHYIAAVHLQ